MTINQINLVIGFAFGLLLGGLLRKSRTENEQRMNWREPIRKAG